MLELEAIFGSGAPVPGYAVWVRLTPCSDLSLATLSLATLSLATLSLATLSLATLSLATLSLATLSVIEWRVPRGRLQRDSIATIDPVPLGAIATLGTVP